MIKDEKEKRALDSIFHNTKSYSNGQDNYNYLTISDALDKLGQLEDIMEKYDFDSPDELNNFLSSMDVEIKKFKANNYLRKVGSVRK